MGSLSRAITYDRDERGITVKGREPYGDTGPVLVAGITPRRGGRESRLQGEVAPSNSALDHSHRE